MESPVGVKGRKWQAADDSVILKSMKDEKEYDYIERNGYLCRIKQTINDEKNNIDTGRFAEHGCTVLLNETGTWSLFHIEFMKQKDHIKYHQQYGY